MADSKYNPDYNFYGDEAEFKNPKYNPLKPFRSYSYYHVLMVSATTDFVLSLNETKGASTDIYLHPDQDGSGQERYSIKKLKVGNSEIEYIVLANTSTDSNLIIDNLEYHSYVSGTVTGDSDTPAELFTDSIKMTISEPFGARFIERMLAACQKLGVQQTQAVFAFKTIFVGHHDNTSNKEGQIEVLSNFNAFDFFVSDITFTFLSSKTVYSITALPAANGLANAPSISEIQKPNWNIPTGTLDSFFKTLEVKANEPVVIKENDPKNKNKRISVYKYRIVNEAYASPTYTISKDMQDFKKGSTKESWIYTVPANSSVHSIISDIVKNCKEIQDESKTDPKKFNKEGVQTVYEPYIYSYVEQKKEGDIVTTILTYRIQKREITVFENQASYDKKQSAVKPIISDTEAQTRFQAFLSTQLEKANLLEFDYIFTGKNNDIIKFDMVFNFGLGVFQDFISTKLPLSNQTQTTPAEMNGGDKSAANIGGPAMKEAEPTVPSAPYSAGAPKPVTGPQKDPYGYEAFQTTLRQYSQYETYATKIEIFGNPRLFQHVTRSPNFDTKQKKEEYVRGAPTFVKINVFMPYVDEKTGFVDFTKTPEKGFRHPFWYDGIFQIVEVNSTFSNGVFKQSLELIQAPTDERSVKQYKIEPGPEAAQTEQDSKKKKKDGKSENTTASDCNDKRTIPDITDGSDGGTGSKNVQAFLRMIRYAEATSGPQDWFRVVNGRPVRTNDKGVLERIPVADIPAWKTTNGITGSFSSTGYTSNAYFTDSSKHPQVYMHFRSEGAPTSTTISSASGAFQILYSTWTGLQKNHPKTFTSFTQTKQELAAVQLIKDNGALDWVKNGQVRLAIKQLQNIWASLGPRHGQGYICEEKLVEAYVKYGGKLAEKA